MTPVSRRGGRGRGEEHKHNLPSAVGFSQSHILQQCPGTSTSRGDLHEIVSSGAGSCSLGQRVEQAWRPFCEMAKRSIKIHYRRRGAWLHAPPPSMFILATNKVIM